MWKDRNAEEDISVLLNAMKTTSSDNKEYLHKLRKALDSLEKEWESSKRLLTLYEDIIDYWHKKYGELDEEEISSNASLMKETAENGIIATNDHIDWLIKLCRHIGNIIELEKMVTDMDKQYEINKDGDE